MPLFSLKFDEEMRSASYMLTFTWDYDLYSAYKRLKVSEKQAEDSDSQPFAPPQEQGKQTKDIAEV